MIDWICLFRLDFDRPVQLLTQTFPPEEQKKEQLESDRLNVRCFARQWTVCWSLLFDFFSD